MPEAQLPNREDFAGPEARAGTPLLGRPPKLHVDQCCVDLLQNRHVDRLRSGLLAQQLSSSRRLASSSIRSRMPFVVHQPKVLAIDVVFQQASLTRPVSFPHVVDTSLTRKGAEQSKLNHEDLLNLQLRLSFKTINASSSARTAHRFRESHRAAYRAFWWAWVRASFA